MSAHRPTLAIVGASLTGGAAASTLRGEGFDGRVVLIGLEPDPPYERPPLSKEYLRGEGDRDQALLRSPAWYADNDVELRLSTRVVAVDPADRVVRLEEGDRVPFDAVLVATGGTNRRLAVPGHDLDGIYDLRTFADADAIRAEAQPGRRAAVVGAGFIGCEVAASLRALGVEVEVVEIFATTLVRVVGPEVGSVYEGIHRDHGVQFHFRQAVERFEGSGERVEAVVTTEGARIECDFVVVGIGIQPATAVVDESDVFVENGIVVDAFCRTNVPGVFAAGDVANHYHPLFERRIRVEHWDNALKQGAAAARNMLGKEVSFDDPHWFWSDQYEHNLQFMGVRSDRDELVVRGSIEERSFVGFYLRDEVVEAVVGVDRGRDVRRSAGLIKARRPVDPAKLRDEEVNLKQLAVELASE